MKPSWEQLHKMRLHYKGPGKCAQDLHTLAITTRGSLRAQVWKCIPQGILQLLGSISEKRVDELMREVKVGFFPGYREQMRMENEPYKQATRKADHSRP